MDFILLFLISIGLAMDAFTVSLTQGLSLKKLHIKSILKVALVFGTFHGVMPLLGWKIGRFFYNEISIFDHWIAFGLLTFIGGKMILGARKFKKCKNSLNIVALGIATSIDALAVGFSFSLLPGLNIYFVITIIGLITFIISFLGVYLGNKVGQLLGVKAEYTGGVILVGMGIKILIQHMM